MCFYDFLNLFMYCLLTICAIIELINQFYGFCQQWSLAHLINPEVLLVIPSPKTVNCHRLMSTWHVILEILNCEAVQACVAWWQCDCTVMEQLLNVRSPCKDSMVKSPPKKLNSRIKLKLVGFSCEECAINRLINMSSWI
jgi:hypothetical protein